MRNLLTILFLFISQMSWAYNAKVDGIYYNIYKTAKEAEVVSGESGYTGDIVIPDNITVGGIVYSVTSIGPLAFSGCKSLTSVTIPNSVTMIMQYTFEYCSSLKSVTIPNSVTSIDIYAFKGCSSLKSVTIPNSVTRIGEGAFYNCTSLTSVVIPNSVTGIGPKAFYNCTSLTSVTMTNSVTILNSEMFSGCTSLTSVVIPNSVTSIDYLAFYCCTSLTSVTIPNSVTSIGKKAFGGCTSLTSVTIPNSVTSIKDETFCDCTSLASVTIPNSVTSIDCLAFYNCTSLTSVTIPNSVTNLESETFSGCTSLKSVVIPNSVKIISDKIFYGCTSLTSVTIPNSVTGIAGLAFGGCTSLKSVVIPNSVTSIGEGAFYNCNQLKDIVLGSKISAIMTRVFANCSSTIDVICYAEDVPYTKTGVFTNSGTSSATLKVPESSINKYKAANPWRLFDTIEAISSLTHTLTYKVDGEIYKEYFIEEGSTITPEEVPTKTGYTFSGWSEIPTTMPDHDVEINGYFTVNQYTISFDTDGGSAIKSITQDYGTAISIPENPTKKGYTFAGWDKAVPTTMPAENITLKAKWNINSYKLIYKVDGEIYKEFTLEYNSNVTPEENLAKTGYTFSGWSEIPSLMPDYDVIVTGSFTVNQYTITFDTDGGSTINPITQDYGSAITAPVNPSKTGYTFVGWNKDIPVTMPAENITIKAKWIINSYKLTYKVDNDIYKEISVEYGSTITPETAPEKDGYTFSGWSEIPSTMPDYDVVITGSFAVNQYIVKFVADGVTVKEDRLDFGTSIVAPENPTKEGYEFKGWDPEVDNTVPSHDVTYTAVFEVASAINAIPLGTETVDVRNINGQLIKKNATKSDILGMPSGLYIIRGKKYLVK